MTVTYFLHSFYFWFSTFYDNQMCIIALMFAFILIMIFYICLCSWRLPLRLMLVTSKLLRLPVLRLELPPWSWTPLPLPLHASSGVPRKTRTTPSSPPYRRASSSQGTSWRTSQHSATPSSPLLAAPSPTTWRTVFSACLIRSTRRQGGTSTTCCLTSCWWTVTRRTWRYRPWGPPWQPPTSLSQGGHVQHLRLAPPHPHPHLSSTSQCLPCGNTSNNLLQCGTPRLRSTWRGTFSSPPCTSSPSSTRCCLLHPTLSCSRGSVHSSPPPPCPGSPPPPCPGSPPPPCPGSPPPLCPGSPPPPCPGSPPPPCPGSPPPPCPGSPPPPCPGSPPPPCPGSPPPPCPVCSSRRSNSSHLDPLPPPCHVFRVQLQRHCTRPSPWMVALIWGTFQTWTPASWRMLKGQWTLHHHKTSIMDSDCVCQYG